MNKVNLLEEKLTYRLRGVFINISKKYGYLFKESVYQKLCKEKFIKEGINFKEKPKIPLFSENNNIICYYYPDFTIENKIIIEIKSRNQLTDNHIYQLIRYLKLTKYQIGLIVNFGTPIAQIIRKINTFNTDNADNTD